jgi:PAS domain S-box-containing protein
LDAPPLRLPEDISVDTSIRVNLHCHSDLSDGQLAPEVLAGHLARSGVRVAALTDHDTIAGLARFREALARQGVGWISGLELSVITEAGPAHLLAYGFDPAAPSILEALVRVQEPARGGLALSEALSLLHRGGGRGFLAHPLELEPELPRLRELLQAFKGLGLDGIEAVYAPYDPGRILSLLELARELGLAVSAGCDFHGFGQPGLSDLGINFPRQDWQAFRSLLLSSPGLPAPQPLRSALPVRRALPKLDWKNFVRRIAVPTLLAIALLVVPLFVFVVPAFEQALLARKREMIRELTASACSILQEYHRDEAAGRMTRRAAQEAAAERIQSLRYGKEGKDYFWITDLHPRMVMHPYRTDLNGTDLSGFHDPNGTPVFVAFTDLVKARQEGYLEYVWQWKDDARKLVPKQSFVRLFEPWGWVVGTGLYMDDVHGEIAGLTGKVVRVTVFLAAIIALLLLFVAQQSFRIERKRTLAEEALRESHERYRALVEASKEGTVMVLKGRAVFANQTFLNLAGYTEAEWGLMDLDELLQAPGEDKSLRRWMDAALAEEDAAPTEGRLHRRDGSSLAVLLAAERIQVGEQEGAILIVRDLSSHKVVVAALGESQARFRAMAENLRVGIFRADVGHGMPVLEANAAALALLGSSARLEEAFAEPSALESFRQELLWQGEVKERILRLTEDRGGVPVALSATLVRDEGGEPKFCDAVLEDVTERQRGVQERDALIAELQTALLYLGEPVKRFMREPLSVDLRTSIQEAAALMSRQDMSALLVKGPSGEPLGLVTDHDLRERVVARDIKGERGVFEVMSSPILTVAPETQGYEALLLMREKGIQHLMVAEEAGPVLGLVRGQDLLQADRYPMALLGRAIREANRPEEVVLQRARLPMLVKSLVDSGARPQHLCRAITAVTDAATEKFLALALAGMGEPPAPFAYLVLGSEGREEQTLLSDQDSALIFDPPPGCDSREIQAFFLAMAERVGGWLERAGYPACQGGMMARNPRWCQSLAAWREHFRGWIRLPEPQNLLEFSTFFDFRCISGEPSLVKTLREQVREELAATPAFLGHMAQATIQYKASLGFFGNLVPHPHRSLDLKEALAPLVHIARLYALRHDLPERSTLDRFRHLQEMGLLSTSGFEELSQSYDFALAFRLKHQAELLVSGAPADNMVELKNLTHLEESLLKQAFTQVSLLQKKVGFDFLGAG